MGRKLVELARSEHPRKLRRQPRLFPEDTKHVDRAGDRRRRDILPRMQQSVGQIDNTAITTASASPAATAAAAASTRGAPGHLKLGAAACCSSLKKELLRLKLGMLLP